jgi:hypothetical protein
LLDLEFCPSGDIEWAREIDGKFDCGSVLDINEILELLRFTFLGDEK